MILAPTRQALNEVLGPVQKGGTRVGLVPTMGYLHDGHLSLVDLARERSGFLAVSVFVNPLQFGPGEDLDRYPRDLDRDLTLLRDRGADLVFHPTVEEMYLLGEPQVTVDPGPMAERLCGGFRPGHFRGVLTVVARLLGIIRPQVAVFGQKDFQQACLIRRMVADLEFGTEILMGPIVREGDGLAMSSRNTFLSRKERGDAVGLYRALVRVQEGFQDGQRSLAVLTAELRGVVEAHPRLRLQYGEIVDAQGLDPVDPVVPGSVVAVAAHCGQTRLIDNLILAD